MILRPEQETYMATAIRRRDDPRAEQMNTPTPVAALATLRELADDRVEGAEHEASCAPGVEKLWLEEAGRAQSSLSTDLGLALLRQKPEAINDIALILDEMFTVTDAIDPSEATLTQAEARALAVSVENCLAFMGEHCPPLRESLRFEYHHSLATKRMGQRSLPKPPAETQS